MFLPLSSFHIWGDGDYNFLWMSVWGEERTAWAKQVCKWCLSGEYGCSFWLFFSFTSAPKNCLRFVLCAIICLSKSICFRLIFRHNFGYFIVLLQTHHLFIDFGLISQSKFTSSRVASLVGEPRSKRLRPDRHLHALWTVLGRQHQVLRPLHQSMENIIKEVNSNRTRLTTLSRH